MGCSNAGRKNWVRELHRKDAHLLCFNPALLVQVNTQPEVTIHATANKVTDESCLRGQPRLLKATLGIPELGGDLGRSTLIFSLQ